MLYRAKKLQKQLLRYSYRTHIANDELTVIYSIKLLGHETHMYYIYDNTYGITYVLEKFGLDTKSLTVRKADVHRGYEWACKGKCSL